MAVTIGIIWQLFGEQGFSMSDGNTKPPNLYQLLGLRPLESNLALIESAIRRLQKRLDPANELKAEDRTRGLRIVALGQKYLLDAKLKSAYDHQWQIAYQTQSAPVMPAATAVPAATAARPTAVEAQVAPSSRADVDAPAPTAPQWDMRQLESLLPTDDPHAPLDIASFLKHSEMRDPLAAEADLLKLISILSQSDSSAVDGQEDSTAVQSNASHVMRTAAEIEPADTMEPAAEQSSLTLTAGSGLPPARSGRAGPLADRARKKKQRSIVIGGVSLAAGVGGLLLLGMYLSQTGSGNATLASGTASSTPSDAPAAPSLPLTTVPNDPLTNAGNDEGAASGGDQAEPDGGRPRRRPRRSGLPQPGESTMPLEIVTTMPAEPKPATEPSTEPSTAPAATPANPATTPAVASTTMPAAATSPPPAEPTPLTVEEMASWKTGMTQARQSLARLDVTKAESELKSLSDSIKNEQQRGQWQRLSEIAGFIKDIREAMVAAIAGMSGGDTFKIGTSTVVSFIEGNENKIIVKLAGTRREFALADMPAAMGVALVDLKMDVAHANSLARKGAYVMLHPKNGLLAKDGKKMLADAAQVGAISAELAQFYEEDYSLAQPAP